MEQRRQWTNFSHGKPAALLRLLAWNHFLHGDIKQRGSFQVMERLGTQKAELGDLCAALFTPELQPMTDTHPHASVKA